MIFACGAVGGGDGPRPDSKAIISHRQATLDSTVNSDKPGRAIRRRTRHAHLIDLVLINDRAEAVTANNVYYQKVYVGPDSSPMSYEGLHSKNPSLTLGK